MLAASPPRKVLQSWHFTIQNFFLLLSWKVSDAVLSIILFTWASSAVCLWISVLFFLPHLFFFWVNNFYHFLYLMLPSLLYYLRKKIQTLWRDTKWKIWERKKKNAKSNRETRKKKEVQQFFLKFFLLLWFKPWKPWTVFRPGRFNRGLNGFMLFMYRTVFWV